MTVNYAYTNENKTDKYFSSDQIKGKKKKYSNVELILTTDALLRTFGVNKHTKFIHVFFRRKCHTTNRDCEHRKPRIVLVIFERVSLDFFIYLFWWIFMTWFYLLFYIVIRLHSKCRKDWGKEAGSRERGAHQVISYKSREIEYYRSCQSQAEGWAAFFLSYTYLRKSVYDKTKKKSS